MPARISMNCVHQSPRKEPRKPVNMEKLMIMEQVACGPATAMVLGQAGSSSALVSLLSCGIGSAKCSRFKVML